MNQKFDDFTKGLAKPVTRRGLLKQFGAGVAAIVFATLGLANKAQAGRACVTTADCPGNQFCYYYRCVKRIGPGG